MKRIFVDTNIILDVLMNRSPFYETSKTVLELADKGTVKAAVAAVSLCNIFFLINKATGSEKAHEVIDNLLDLFFVIDTSAAILKKATNDRWTDFEDAIQYHSAASFRATAIISRDTSGFKKSRIPVLAPPEFLALNK